MNQILVTEKLYVTPELKRKKRIYKINFIISIVVIVILISFYIHSEYARNKEQDISQDILAGIVEEEMNESERVAASEEENVWKIMIASVEQQQANSEQSIQTTEQNNNNSQLNTQNGNGQTSVSTTTTISARPAIRRLRSRKLVFGKTSAPGAYSEMIAPFFLTISLARGR